PPADDTRCNTLARVAPNTMTPSRFQVPPPPEPPETAGSASHNTSGGPPAASIFFSLPSAKKPMNLLSGDQNGADAPSVPASGCADSPLNGRTHSCTFPSASRAMNARRWPSGDIARMAPLQPGKVNEMFVFGGGRIVAR